VVLRSARCPVLVRREDQFAILEEALLAAHRGEGRFVVVSGDAGIGKTRLVTELSRLARGLGEVLLGHEAHRRVERWLAERNLRASREELTLKGFEGPQVAYRIDGRVGR